MTIYKDKSKIHGIGLFTDTEIKKGDFILLVADIKRLNSSREFITIRGKLINHKTDCNCFIRLVADDKYHLFAIRDIEPNEELTTDYSLLKYPFKSDVTGYKD
jgi:SET domain-containing protein